MSWCSEQNFLYFKKVLSLFNPHKTHPRPLLSLLSPQDAVHVLSLSHVDTSALYEPRARTVSFDWPPFEQRNGAHAADDATGTIAPATII